MIFDEDFIENLPTDLSEALSLICDKIHEFDEMMPQEEELDHYADYIDGFAALETFIQVNGLESKIPIPELSDNRATNIQRIRGFYNAVKNKTIAIKALNTLESARFKYKSKMNAIFSYHLTEGDIRVLQDKINELRNHILSSKFFTDNHRERLLKKLEQLQREVHKRMSTLDKFYSLIGEAGVALGQFGRDAQPFMDLVKDILKIVWRSQAAAEGLPSGMDMPFIEGVETIEKARQD